MESTCTGLPERSSNWELRPTPASQKPPRQQRRADPSDWPAWLPGTIVHLPACWVITHREVTHQLSFGLLTSEPSKMEAAAPPCGDTDLDWIADRPPELQAARNLLATPVSINYNHAVCPASTESLLGRTMGDLLHTPMINIPLSLAQSPMPQGHLSDMAQLLNRFFLNVGHGPAQITSIKADLHSLGFV